MRRSYRAVFEVRVGCWMLDVDRSISRRPKIFTKISDLRLYEPSGLHNNEGETSQEHWQCSPFSHFAKCGITATKSELCPFQFPLPSCLKRVRYIRRHEKVRLRGMRFFMQR